MEKLKLPPNFELLFVSNPKHNYLTAELYYNKEQWAMVSIEDGFPLIRIFGPTTNPYWAFNLNDALEVLEAVKQEMLAIWENSQQNKSNI